MKVCIVGAAPSSINLTPYNDPSWEIWGCSSPLPQLPRVDVAFEVHNYNRKVVPLTPEHKAWLENFEGLVWMMAEYPQVKGCEVLPHKALMKKYSPYFFTSTIAWMMAMAIEVADEIMICGVDMAAATEYYDQKMGCQFFATVAKNKGIKVSVPPESDLLRPPPLYGVREYQHGWIKNTTREREMTEKVALAISKKANALSEEQFYAGAANSMDYEAKTWLGSIDGDGQEFCTVPRIDL